MNGNHADCARARELIPAYSIGATDPAETAFVEELLPHCPDLVAELNEYLRLADGLLYAMPAAVEGAPPRELRGELRSQLAASRPANRPTNRPTARHSMASHSPELLPKRHSAANLKLTPPAIEQRQRRGLSAAWLTGIAAVLALVMLFLSNVFWFNQVNNLQTNQAQLVVLLEEARTQPMATPVLIGDFFHRNLNATADGLPDSHATVIWNPDTAIGSLYVSGLPQLDNEHHYQLWLVRDGIEVSVGAFKVDADGSGMLLFQSSEPIENYDAIGVSTEPVVGSPRPTTPHLVIGEI